MAILGSNKKLVSFLCASVGAVLVSVLLNRLNLVQEIENRTWDWKVKNSAEYSVPDKNIRIIEVDQYSLEEQAALGFTWPWPRSRYVNIIKFLELAQAKGLAFDVLFTEASSYGAKDDDVFTAALQSRLPVLNIATLTNSKRDFDESLFEVFAYDLHLHNEKTAYTHLYTKFQNVPGVKHDYESVVLPIDKILDKGTFYGNVGVEPDSDGVMRHYTIGGEVRGIPVLNSPFAFYDLVEGNASKFLKLENFFDNLGRFAVKFHSADGGYRPVSASALIQSYEQITKGERPLVDPSEFKDAWVYFGLTAPGLYDLKPTALNKKGKGVEYLANVLDNILHQDFILKSKLWQNVLMALLLSMLISFIVFRDLEISNQVFLVLLVFGIFIFSQYYSAVLGYWISFSLPFLAGLLSLILALTMQFFLEGRQHRFIRNAFRHYVSPSLIEEIVKNPETLSLGGEKKLLTIFFSDIEGFTSISEKLDAGKLVSLMNSFLSEMTGIVQTNFGTVDKYIGDAIMAFWNAPLEVSDHAYHAVKTGMQCQTRLKELESYYFNEFGVQVKMRVGINTAQVNVGNFGSRERFSYTVLGDGVNLASRLEGVNKFFSTNMLITSATNSLLNGRLKTRKVGDIRVVGKSEAIEIFEPYTEQNYSPERDAVFANALAAYYAGNFDQAISLFKSLDGDPVSRAYILRLESELNTGKDMDWSPVWNLTAK